MKEKIKKIVLFILNPKLLLCVGIAWMITNGWSYAFLALGAWFDIGWMAAVGSAYMTLLWFPFTPEKILTGIIAIFLLKTIFPKDERTLGILLGLHKKVMEKHKARKKKRELQKSSDEENR